MIVSAPHIAVDDTLTHHMPLNTTQSHGLQPTFERRVTVYSHGHGLQRTIYSTVVNAQKHSKLRSVHETENTQIYYVSMRQEI